jgi:hypothetical protein
MTRGGEHTRAPEFPSEPFEGLWCPHCDVRKSNRKGVEPPPPSSPAAFGRLSRLGLFSPSLLNGRRPLIKREHRDDFAHWPIDVRALTDRDSKAFYQPSALPLTLI